MTLVELLMATVVIGILATIGVSSLHSARVSATLNDAAAMVGGAVSQGVRTVRKTSRPATISFNTAGRTVTVTSNSAVVASRTLPVTGMSLSCRTACPSNTVTLSSPSGALAQDFSVTLTLAGKSRTVKILGPSALVVRQ